MNFFIKYLFTVLGAVFVGFGLGIMARKNDLLSPPQFEVAVIMSLIAGGFFIALGLPGRKTRIENNPEPQDRDSLPQN